jgi:hypothetical protein
MSLVPGRWRSRGKSQLQWWKLGLTGFLLFTFTGTTDELEGRVVCLVLCDVVALDVLPDVALFARYLWCVVVLRQLVTMSLWYGNVNVRGLTRKYRTFRNQRTNPPLRSAA